MSSDSTPMNSMWSDSLTDLSSYVIIAYDKVKKSYQTASSCVSNVLSSVCNSICLPITLFSVFNKISPLLIALQYYQYVFYYMFHHYMTDDDKRSIELEFQEKERLKNEKIEQDHVKSSEVVKDQPNEQSSTLNHTSHLHSE